MGGGGDNIDGKSDFASGIRFLGSIFFSFLEYFSKKNLNLCGVFFFECWVFFLILQPNWIEDFFLLGLTCIFPNFPGYCSEFCVFFQVLLFCRIFQWLLPIFSVFSRQFSRIMSIFRLFLPKWICLGLTSISPDFQNIFPTFEYFSRFFVSFPPVFFRIY